MPPIIISIICIQRSKRPEGIKRCKRPPIQIVKRVIGRKKQLHTSNVQRSPRTIAGRNNHTGWQEITLQRPSELIRHPSMQSSIDNERAGDHLNYKVLLVSLLKARKGMSSISLSVLSTLGSNPDYAVTTYCSLKNLTVSSRRDSMILLLNIFINMLSA